MESQATENEEEDVHLAFIKAQLAAVDLTLKEAIKGTELEHKERREVWARRMRKFMSDKLDDNVKHKNVANVVKTEDHQDNVKLKKIGVVGLSEKRMILLDEIETERDSSLRYRSEASPRRLERTARQREKEMRRRRTLNSEQHRRMFQIDEQKSENVQLKASVSVLEPIADGLVGVEAKSIANRAEDGLRKFPTVEGRRIQTPKRGFQLREAGTRPLCEPWLWN